MMMVEKITKVSSSAATTPTRVETSLSLAEPDLAWIADRQSAITAANQQRKRKNVAARKRATFVECSLDGVSDPKIDSEESIPASTEEENAQFLSGESERIGSGNLDEEVPFGQHVGYV
ncbi:hypothetical protein AX761_23070 [Rhizobium sp. 58]|nr:hypothetical protein AX761_23070 [Rhizobium sp. 58]